MSISFERLLTLVPARPSIPTVAGAPRVRPALAGRGAALRSLAWLAPALAVLLPLALATVYVSHLAVPQFPPEAQFVIRGAEGTEGGSRGGLLAAFGSGVEGAFDGYAIRAHLESADALVELDRRIGYAQIM